MIVTVPVRAALGFAATIWMSLPGIEARAQDASPWLRDGHSAVRLLAGSRSAAVRLLEIGQCRGRDHSVAGAAGIRRWRRWAFARLSRPDRAALADRRKSR